jgi:hypothetical protein
VGDVHPLLELADRQGAAVSLDERIVSWYIRFIEWCAKVVWRRR